MRWWLLLAMIAGCDATGALPDEELGGDFSMEPDTGVHPDLGFADAGFEDGGFVDDGGLLPDSGVASEWSMISAALAARCRGCHNNTPRPRMDEWDRIVGVASSQVPLPLVAPGDPDNSYLLAKLSNTHVAICDRLGVTRTGCGRRMPSTGAVLAPQMVERIRAWIAAGATRD